MVSPFCDFSEVLRLRSEISEDEPNAFEDFLGVLSLLSAHTVHISSAKEVFDKTHCAMVHLHDCVTVPGDGPYLSSRKNFPWATSR